MGAVLSVLLIIRLLQGIFGLWILLKAYQVSLGWFLFLLPLYLGAGVLWAEALGPILGAAIVLGGTLLFVVSHWQEVRTPFLLAVAAGVVHTFIVVQAERTLAEQAKQAPIEQVR